MTTNCLSPKKTKPGGRGPRGVWQKTTLFPDFFSATFPYLSGFFRSAFWFVWWNLQEIYDGFDKSRAMWVFQHKYSSFVWKLLKPSGGSQLRWRIGSQAGTVVTIQADRPIQIPWCEDHQEVNTKIPRSQWENIPKEIPLALPRTCAALHWRWGESESAARS